MALVLRREKKSVTQASRLTLWSGPSASMAEMCSISSFANAAFISSRFFPGAMLATIWS